MTQTEYAKHSGLTKGRVSQLVKRGMPLASPDAADRWRGMTARRPPRRPIPKLGEPAKPDAPSDPPPAAEKVEAAHQQAQAPTPVEATPAASSYQRAEQIEKAAYALAVRSLREKHPDAGRLVAVHATTASNVIRTRQDVLALEQQEGRLLTSEWVQRIITEHDGAVVALIKSLPRTMAGRIAPHDCEHAEAELERWVEEEFLRTLYRSNPWNNPKT